MSRHSIGDKSSIALRINASDKAVILRAAALEQTKMTSFILRAALREAQSVIERNERFQLTGRDSLLVMELLENPPAPNAKLQQAARDLPSR